MGYYPSGFLFGPSFGDDLRSFVLDEAVCLPHFLERKIEPEYEVTFNPNDNAEEIYFRCKN